MITFLRRKKSPVILSDLSHLSVSLVKFYLPLVFDGHMIIPPSSELLDPSDWLPSLQLPQSELMSSTT